MPAASPDPGPPAPAGPTSPGPTSPGPTPAARVLVTLAAGVAALVVAVLGGAYALLRVGDVPVPVAAVAGPGALLGLCLAAGRRGGWTAAVVPAGVWLVVTWSVLGQRGPGGDLVLSPAYWQVLLLLGLGVLAAGAGGFLGSLPPLGPSRGRDEVPTGQG